MVWQDCKMRCYITEKEWFCRFLHPLAGASYVVTDAFQHGVQPLLLHFVIGVIVLHHVNKELLTIYSIYDIVQFAKQLFILYQIQRVNLVAILLPVQQIYQVEDATVLSAEVNLQRLFISNKKETIISIVLSVYVCFFTFRTSKSMVDTSAIRRGLM